MPSTRSKPTVTGGNCFWANIFLPNFSVFAWKVPEINWVMSLCAESKGIWGSGCGWLWNRVQLPGHGSCFSARDGQETEEQEGQGEASTSVCHHCAAVS